MKELLKAFFESMMEETVETPVGKVPEEIRMRLKEMKKSEKQMKRDLENRMKEVAEQVKRDFEDRADDLDDEHTTIWEDIYDHFGIDGADREKKYTVDYANGEVTVFEKVEKSEHPIQ